MNRRFVTFVQARSRSIEFRKTYDFIDRPVQGVYRGVAMWSTTCIRSTSRRFGPRGELELEGALLERGSRILMVRDFIASHQRPTERGLDARAPKQNALNLRLDRMRKPQA
jgi:hypothetical protein